jgi:signal transduction histidine kinase
MLRALLNWKTLLGLVAIVIVSGTISYSQYLAKKIASRERLAVEQWIEASKFLINAPSDANITFASRLVTENKSIPIIETNEKDSITNYVNIDAKYTSENPGFLSEKLKEFKRQHKAIEWTDPRNPSIVNRYYYGDSALLVEVRYYPIVQLFIVGLFITVILLNLRSSHKSAQNQVWAGMAKETAHQLGTPVSSLEGWVEILKDIPGNEKVINELEKDVDRLRLISDRFGKIGSTPHLEETEIVAQIQQMVDYMRRRAPEKIQFSVLPHAPILAKISAPLFDWVMENLLKNALDAMDGTGSITVDLSENNNHIIIDVTDTGKGILGKNIGNVFKPGFTTKKRGWGLGLSLSKRIIEQYHKGQIFVKHSEINKGTTFTIILKK